MNINDILNHQSDQLKKTLEAEYGPNPFDKASHQQRMEFIKTKTIQHDCQRPAPTPPGKL